MILLDTHIWFWWVQGHKRLDKSVIEHMDKLSIEGFTISAISCWEIALLYSKDRVSIPCQLDEWFDKALAYPGITEEVISREIAIEATRIPQPFHADPADRILVSTSRLLSIPLLTADKRILAYDHVQSISPKSLTNHPVT